MIEQAIKLHHINTTAFETHLLHHKLKPGRTDPS